MRKKSILKCITKITCIIAVITTTCIPAFAAETEPYTSTGTKQTEVSYSQNSTFSVTLPKKIPLNSDKKGNYEISVNGDIKGDEKVVVIPDSTITMIDAEGKNNVTGTITQIKTEFTYTDFISTSDDDRKTTGTISVANLSAGNWTGTFNFNISLI